MRGFGFYGSARRNQPVKLENPHPHAEHGMTSIESGNAALDGFTVLSRSNADAQGCPPAVSGTVSPVYQGPDHSFEQ